jgi:hypothetical protein
MKHGRVDYDDHIQDEGELIDPDEPVMLFRAKDKHMPAVMRFYAGLVAGDPQGDIDLIENLQLHMQLVDDWQSKNGCKRPDVA